MNNVTDCIFLGEALAEANDTDAVIQTAEKCLCSGECTLENGCKLYKELRDTSEVAFSQRLRSEFLYHMLGE